MRRPVGVGCLPDTVMQPTDLPSLLLAPAAATSTAAEALPRVAFVHPLAVVERGARLEEGVHIGPFCHVGAQAVLGAGTRLMSHVCIYGRSTLGRDNVLWPGAVIGADPQDLKFQGEESTVVIGSGNQIREMVTIQKGTANGGGVTQVGDHNLIMVGAHVAHDCQVGHRVIIANGVQLAGHVHVHDHAIISGLVAIHHFVSIGAYAYVGGMARVTSDVPPFVLFEGHPGRVRALNVIGLERHRFPAASLAALKVAFRRLFRALRQSADPSAPARLSISQRLDQLEQEFPDDPHIARLVTFMRNSMSGLYGRYLEGLRQDNRRKNPTK